MGPIVQSSTQVCSGGSDLLAMSGTKPNQQRPFLGVMFECCRQYVRVYINPTGDAYVGRCPRCAKSVRFVVGEGGSASRMWRVQ
ncbi:MAG: hypothetical protein VX944_00430 [Myxococcota bacterium]|nr:hypothetical protein [Myxococcota bacterium]MEC9388516.1 hypothetical protein [Myxococcota bacterium]